MQMSKWILILGLCVIAVSAQPRQSTDEWLYVGVPRSTVLPVIAVQDDCPIAFEEVNHRAYVSGGFFNSYKLRNVGTKSIRGFTIATSSGTEFTMPSDTGQVVQPGELIPEPRHSKGRVVPLTGELRDRLSITGPMKGIVVFMVVNVEFTDGTSFRDETTYRAMTVFMDTIGDALRHMEEIRKNRPEKQKSPPKN
jgi:hypothetical protein